MRNYGLVGVIILQSVIFGCMSFVSALTTLMSTLCPSNIKKHSEALLFFFLSIEITGSKNRHTSICIPLPFLLFLTKMI